MIDQLKDRACENKLCTGPRFETDEMVVVDAIAFGAIIANSYPSDLDIHCLTIYQTKKKSGMKLIGREAELVLNFSLPSLG